MKEERNVFRALLAKQRADRGVRLHPPRAGWRSCFRDYEGVAVGGGRFRNTEILTFRGGQVIDVEVYFGWSIPHDAKAGSFVDKD